MKMYRKILSAVRAALFILVSAIMVSCLGRTFAVKNFVDSQWPETTGFENFYDLEENSVDVLILGSSFAMSSVIPQELYDNYGITAYNLGSEEQNLVVSYYWLREALKTQKPKVVIVDLGFVFDNYMSESPLNSMESCLRLAMDSMRMGAVKAEAIHTICEVDETLDELSYYFPCIRFHERWKGLTEQDILYEEYSNTPGLMGYAMLTGTSDYDYEPFEAGTTDECYETVPLMTEYLGKIAGLCEEEGMELILIKTPVYGYEVTAHNAMAQLAGEYGAALYDFNESSLYDEISFVFSEDMVDGGHSSHSGAVKITGYLGSVLQEEYGLEPHVSEAWEAGRQIYADTLTDRYLEDVSDWEEYFSILEDNVDRYTIFISAKDALSVPLEEDIISHLQNLGLMSDGSYDLGNSYCAVVEKGTVLEEEQDWYTLELSGAIRGGRTSYYILSVGNTGDGNDCTSTIRIGGVNYSPNKTGLNIVVYDNVRKAVLDQRVYDGEDETTS